MTCEEQIKKALSGAIYNDVTPEFVKLREKAYFLTKEYEESYGKSGQEREMILKKLFKSMGKNPFLEPGFRCEFGFNITVGDNFYANFDCVLLDAGGIEIGNNVLFGPRVGIYTTRHAFDATERAAGACFTKPVIIGDNVWVGAGVHMDHGIKIGNNSIIGAGSVITRDIPPNVVAAGAPCRIIREISESEKTNYFEVLKTEY